MRYEYLALKKLEASEGYKLLQELWIHQVSEIEKARDKAAQRGQDSAWRYWAGQEKGAKIMMMELARALAHMEKEADEENEVKENSPDALLKELRGEP